MIVIVVITTPSNHTFEARLVKLDASGSAAELHLGSSADASYMYDIYIYIYIHVIMCVYIYIHIYIYRERERERDLSSQVKIAAAYAKSGVGPKHVLALLLDEKPTVGNFSSQGFEVLCFSARFAWARRLRNSKDSCGNHKVVKRLTVGELRRELDQISAGKMQQVVRGSCLDKQTVHIHKAKH